MKNKTIGLLLIITLASLSRFLPHPPNMTPIIGISILSVACFNHRGLQFGLPLMVMLVTDTIIGFHQLLPVVYLAIIVSGLGGYLLKKNSSFLNILGTGLLGSILFFIVTNLGVFMVSDLYPKSLSGLITCFTLALPFFHNTLIGTCIVLFGVTGLITFVEKKVKNKLLTKKV